MDSRWYKEQNNKKRKRQTLHSLGIGFVSFVALFVLTKIFSVSLCPVKYIFGIECFGCGMTRGFISILQLDFNSAGKYNVLAIPLFVSISVYSICAIVDIIFDKESVFIIEKFLSRKYMYLIYITILIAATIFNNR